MVEGGQLPAIRVGKQWRFARDEVERWLQTSRTQALRPSTALPAASPGRSLDARIDHDLRTLLPLACVQLIQDTFAEMLGVMVLITDMRGQPITQVSNPCGFFGALVAKNPRILEHCVRTWHYLAGDPALAPRFSTSELDLLCARGVIRVGTELKGMVVLGGIAPEAWPPSAERVSAMAQALDVDPAYVQANIDAVYRLDGAAQGLALRFVQRIADIISHVIEDRTQVASNSASS